VSHVGLFVAGTVVTLIVSASLALLVWGAILDGREEARQRALRMQEKLEARRRSRRVIRPVSDRVPPHAA
jgi:hypothetical protein